MKQADVVKIEDIYFNSNTGRLRIQFSIDQIKHSVNAIYHHPPFLQDNVWKFCVAFLSITCLIDIATACLAKKIILNKIELGLLGRRVFNSVSKALRLEIVAENIESLKHLNFRLFSNGSENILSSINEPLENRVLLLMGGGKDSLYSYHLLRQAGFDLQFFYLTEARRTWQQLRNIYKLFSDEIVQHRVYIDVNRRGKIDFEFGEYYTSQFQIGQIIAACLPYAIANRCKYVALGLEKSSDDPMMFYKGRPVNHQYQKSSGFLEDLNRYLSWVLMDKLKVISPLHGLYDLGIYARLIYEAPQLVKFQSSCGGSNYISRNCGKCDKCAFIGALLAGLSGNRELYSSLFVRDPLNNVELYDIWLEEGDDRPLTCVGLKDEIILALSLAKARGWNCKLFDEYGTDAFSKVDEIKLRHYLELYPSKIVPENVWTRIRPFLRYKKKIISHIYKGL